AHVLVALLALGARSDAARRVSTPTPAVVTPTRMPARRRPPGVRLGLDRRSGPVGSAFLVDVADDILAIDCDSADRVEVVQEIATELQGHGYRPFGLLPVGPVTNICSSPSFVERQAG